MTLKEKFSGILPWYSEKDNSNKSNECVKIADDYAISFAEWMAKEYWLNSSGKYTQGQTHKQLLEIFKREQGY